MRPKMQMTNGYIFAKAKVLLTVKDSDKMRLSIFDSYRIDLLYQDYMSNF